MILLKSIIKQKKLVLKRFLVLGIIIISFVPLNLYGADKKSIKKTSQTPKAIQHIEGSFDVNTEKLPPDFRGHNIKKVIEKWSKIDKDEFETTAQYEEKLEKIGINNVLVFREDAIVRYDADNQRLLIKAPWGRIIEEVTNLGSYMGQNAFGVKKKINRIDYVFYALKTRIALDFDEHFEWIEDKNDSYRYEIMSILPEEGKRIKDDLKWLIICKIKPADLERYNSTNSITGLSRSHYKATIDDPLESKRTVYFLSVEVNEVWLFNFKTGEILKKKTITTN